ncbi:MAG: redox-regulated ATPase YchF [Patescibacteria group bacterium]
MKLSIGIVGLPNVGKSTLFKLLTNQEVNIANYPFATIDPNIGVVPVPDERLEKLAKLSNSKKQVPAVVEFYDIAGLVKGANVGEGLGNKFLSHIREVSAILQIIRCFGDGEIIHVEGSVHPIRDLETIKTELILKDLDTVKKREEKAGSDARGGKPEAIKMMDSLKAIEQELDNGIFLSANQKFINDHKDAIKEINLLTAKPQLFLLNGAPEDVSEELKNKIKELNANYIIADLAKTNAVPELIKEAYKILNLISFLTTGEDETRAWTIEKGMKAPKAAGVIHTDFEKKFIRAEVINWQKLIEAAHSASSGQSGWNQAKQKGWLKLEGKEYVVADGDVVVIRHG